MSFLFLILSSSILMSLIILLTLAFFSFFPERLSGKTRYFIWIIIIIGLLIPFRPTIGNALFTIELPIQNYKSSYTETTKTMSDKSSMENLNSISSDINYTTDVDNISNENSLSDIKTKNISENNIISSIKDNITLTAFILVIWLLGAFISFSRYIYNYYQFRRIIKRWAKPVEGLATLELFDIIKEDMGLQKKDIKLLLCPTITTPMLTGFIKPSILLPDKEILEDEMELILEHELTHYKHKDIFINLLGTLALSLHWFNPIVYLSYPYIQGDSELCCDEAVLNNHDTDYRQFYGEVIISMIERANKNQIAFTTCFYTKKLNIKRRLMAIMKTNKNKKVSLIAITLFSALIVISGSAIAFAAPARKSNIGSNKAKSIALKDAGLKNKDVKFTTVRLENEDGIKVYSVEFYKDQKEYDYEIDAVSGKILEKDFDIENFTIPMKKNNTQLIGIDKAKNIALNDSGINANQASFIKHVLESDDGRQIYNIEFYSGQTEYDYEIDALSGKILEKDKDVENFNIPAPVAAPSTTANNTAANTAQIISLDKAKSIALSHAGVSLAQVHFQKASLTKDDGMDIFDIEFIANNVEYDYEINAFSGQILDFDQEREDD